MSVVGIAIHNFIDTSERVAPDNPRFHGQLHEHVRDMLEQAVLRRVLDTPPRTGRDRTERPQLIGKT